MRGRKRGPAVNDRSIETALIIWMSGKSNSEESRQRLLGLTSRIAAHSATGSLGKLVAEGCDRDTLLRSLGFACGRPVELEYDNWFTEVGPQSVRTLFGLGGRGFLALKERLLRAADDIESLNHRFEFGILLTTRHLEMFQGLPDLIRGYVSLLELGAEKLGRGAHFYRNLGKAILTSYVKRVTGHFRDQQVSALLDAVSDTDGYGAVNQRDWRQEHRDLLATISPLVPIFTSDSVRKAIENL